MNAEAPYLAVHVLGPGYGECIVLEMPGCNPAVIDCGSARAAVWAIGLLRDHLKADELSFLAITHPHEDHFDGFSRIVREYGKKAKQIWFFPGFVTGDVVARMLMLASLGAAPDELEGELFCASVAHEWSDLWDLFCDLELDHMEMQEFPKQISLTSQLTIHCLLPVRRLATQFAVDLAKCAPEWLWIRNYPNKGEVDLESAERERGKWRALDTVGSDKCIAVQ